MPTYSFSPTSTVTFGGLDSVAEVHYGNVHLVSNTINIRSIPQPFTSRSKMSVATPAQPIFSNNVVVLKSASRSLSVSNTITMSHSATKNNNYHFSITHHLIPS